MTTIEQSTPTDAEFRAFQKIPRLFRECTITEKIDGTNAQVFISPIVNVDFALDAWTDEVTGEHLGMMAGSRNRYITPENDNYGFAAWVKENCQELRKLGIGKHYGEWWGRGIQRNYGLNERRFSLFNVSRWDVNTKPDCCNVVPIIYQGPFSTEVVQSAIKNLSEHGSVAALGFKDPEGVVVHHSASNTLFKVTVKNDDKPKSKV